MATTDAITSDDDLLPPPIEYLYPDSFESQFLYTNRRGNDLYYGDAMNQTLGPTNQLRQAASRGDVGLVSDLLRAGVPMEIDKDGKGPLHYAALNGHASVVKILLDARTDVDHIDSLGYTALHKASAQGHREVLQLLLSHGADVNRQDTLHGNSPLHESAWHGYSGSVEILCRSGSYVNIVNKSNFTALHLAAQNGHNQSSRVLLYAGCNPDAKNNYGDTALHTASRYGHAGVGRILISARCRINEVNKNWDTALHIASALKRRKIARLLHMAGADARLRNLQSESSIDVARRKGHEEILNILQSAPTSRGDGGGEGGSRPLFNMHKHQTFDSMATMANNAASTNHIRSNPPKAMGPAPHNSALMTLSSGPGQPHHPTPGEQHQVPLQAYHQHMNSAPAGAITREPTTVAKVAHQDAMEPNSNQAVFAEGGTVKKTKKKSSFFAFFRKNRNRSKERSPSQPAATAIPITSQNTPNPPPQTKISLATTQQPPSQQLHNNYNCAHGNQTSTPSHGQPPALGTGIGATRVDRGVRTERVPGLLSQYHPHTGTQFYQDLAGNVKQTYHGNNHNTNYHQHHVQQHHHTSHHYLGPTPSTTAQLPSRKQEYRRNDMIFHPVKPSPQFREDFRGPIGYAPVSQTCTCINRQVNNPNSWNQSHVPMGPCLEHGYAEYHGTTNRQNTGPPPSNHHPGDFYLPNNTGLMQHSQTQQVSMYPETPDDPGRLVRSRSDESLNMSEHKQRTRDERIRQLAIREMKAMQRTSGQESPIRGRREQQMTRSSQALDNLESPVYQRLQPESLRHNAPPRVPVDVAQRARRGSALDDLSTRKRTGGGGFEPHLDREISRPSPDGQTDGHTEQSDAGGWLPLNSSTSSTQRPSASNLNINNQNFTTDRRSSVDNFKARYPATPHHRQPLQSIPLQPQLRFFGKAAPMTSSSLYPQQQMTAQLQAWYSRFRLPPSQTLQQHHRPHEDAELDGAMKDPNMGTDV